MDVSIIIVSYNTKNILRDCVLSIKDKSHDIDYEIIVVDNASSDGSVEMLRQEFPDVKIIESGGNIGFGKANNKGMAQATGKYLFLLNSDTILLNNATKILFDKAESLSDQGCKIGALGSVLLNKDLNTCHSYGHFITPSSELKEVISKYLKFLKDPANTNPPLVKGVKDVDYITGADMFVPEEVYKETGGFDPDFFMYCEEVDWQKRMQKNGYSRIIVEGPKIIHLEGGSDNEQKKLWTPKRLSNLYKSRKIYRKKHYNKYTLPLFRIFRLLLDTPSILLLALLTRRKEYLHLIKLV